MQGIIPMIATFLLTATPYGCNDGSSASHNFEAARFFPMTPGKAYVYQETTPDGTGEIRLQFENPTATVDSIAASVIPMKEIVDNGVIGEFTYQAIDKTKGLLNYGEDDLEAGCVERLNPAFAIPNGLAQGSTMTQVVNVAVTGTGPGCLDASRVEYIVTYENAETVTVPLGTYKNCAKIRIIDKWMDAAGTELAKGDKLMYLAPGVGMVKEIEFEEAGEAVMELTAIETGS